PSGASVIAEADTPFYLTLRRVEFDGALLEYARAAGAVVREAARVTEMAVDRDGVSVELVDGTRVRGRLVVGADGVNSIVARAAGLSHGFDDATLAIDTMEETPRAQLDIFDRDTMYVAYGY